MAVWLLVILLSVDSDTMFAVNPLPYHDQERCELAAIRYQDNLQTLPGSSVKVYCLEQSLDVAHPEANALGIQ